eukprot:487290-Rhodomonas_salina.1
MQLTASLVQTVQFLLQRSTRLAYAATAHSTLGINLLYRDAWAGLPSHPQHEIWARDFTGAAGLFSFQHHALPQYRSAIAPYATSPCLPSCQTGILYPQHPPSPTLSPDVELLSSNGPQLCNPIL